MANGASVTLSNDQGKDADRNWRAIREKSERQGAEIARLEAENVQLRAEITQLREGNKTEYERGWSDGQRDYALDAAFEERLSAARDKYGSEIDLALEALRAVPMPETVLDDIAGLDFGLDAAFELSKHPALCAELAAADPERAQQRFRIFLTDMLALKGK